MQALEILEIWNKSLSDFITVAFHHEELHCVGVHRVRNAWSAIMLKFCRGIAHWVTFQEQIDAYLGWCRIQLQKQDQIWYSHTDLCGSRGHVPLQYWESYFFLIVIPFYNANFSVAEDLQVKCSLSHIPLKLWDTWVNMIGKDYTFVISDGVFSLPLFIN